VETVETYLDRKFREIALFNSCLALPFDLHRPASAGAAIEQKFRLAAALKAQEALRSWGVTETARPPIQRATAGAFEFSFGYQRADLNVHGPPIYPSLCSPTADVVQETMYTSSGMSALAALMTSLLRIKESAEVLAPPGCYSETRELIECFGGRVRILPLEAARSPRPSTTSVARILLLDSSVAAGFFGFLRIPVHEIDLVIFDTTCYWRSSARIQRVANWTVQSKLPLALVRSHAKLDCLGVEYGRLGSVVVAVPPKGIPSPRSDWTTDLTAETRNSVRLFGAAPIPASFPPFAGTRQFEHCSVARVAAIIRNNRRMAQALSAKLGSTQTVAEFQHGLYLTLMPNAELSIESARKLAAALCGDLVSTAVPVSHAGSFGFDFVAIEWFADPLSRRNVLRVAASDVPFHCIDRVAEGIARWWSRRALTVRGSSHAVCTTNNAG
jgi:hypothetical protein